MALRQCLFASLGTGLIGFAIGQAVDIAKGATDPAHPELLRTLCVACSIAGVVCYAISIAAFVFRRSEISKIVSAATTPGDGR